MIISPSLLSCDFMNIQKELNFLEQQTVTPTSLWLHLDIMDGHFVPNMTFGLPIVEQISKITSIKLDAHLMVTNPGFYIDRMKGFNLHNLTFHYEAVKPEECLNLILEAKKYYPSVGISIRPGTDITTISHDILDAIDLFLVMSVEPGFGGQSFMPNSLDKLDYLVNYFQKKSITLQIDGGIDDKTAPLVKSHGANNLVAGSYIFKNGPTTYKTKIEQLINC